MPLSVPLGMPPRPLSLPFGIPHSISLLSLCFAISFSPLVFPFSFPFPVAFSPPLSAGAQKVDPLVPLSTLSATSSSWFGPLPRSLKFFMQFWISGPSASGVVVVVMAVGGGPLCELAGEMGVSRTLDVEGAGGVIGHTVALVKEAGVVVAVLRGIVGDIGDGEGGHPFLVDVVFPVAADAEGISKDRAEMLVVWVLVEGKLVNILKEIENLIG